MLHVIKSDSADLESSLSSRVEALETKVKELQNPRVGQLSKLGVVLGVVATVLALPSAFLNSERVLFPRPETTLRDPITEMQYDPTTLGLTFTVTVVVSNDGNKFEVLKSPEGKLATATRELSTAKIGLADEGGRNQTPPLIIPPGSTSKIIVTPTFTYSALEDGDKSLLISFRTDRSQVLQVRVCFPLEAEDLQQARAAFTVSASECGR